MRSGFIKSSTAEPSFKNSGLLTTKNFLFVFDFKYSRTLFPVPTGTVDLRGASVTTGAGVSVGNQFAVGGGGQATFDDGVATIGVEGDLAAYVGLDVDLSVSIDTNQVAKDAEAAAKAAEVRRYELTPQQAQEKLNRIAAIQRNAEAKAVANAEAAAAAEALRFKHAPPPGMPGAGPTAPPGAAPTSSPHSPSDRRREIRPRRARCYRRCRVARG
jgi:hypothetical protein